MAHDKWLETLLICHTEVMAFENELTKVFTAIEDKIVSDCKEFGFEEREDSKELTYRIVLGLAQRYFDDRVEISNEEFDDFDDEAGMEI